MNRKRIGSILAAVIMLAGLLAIAGCAGDDGAVGPAGLRGLQGEQGAQGDTGSRGTTGSQGEQGIPGTDGSQGAAGEQGIQGLVGADGTDGATGATGPRGGGSRGATGATGAPGLRGLPGDDGVDGADGADGGYGNVLLTGVIHNAAFRLLATQNADGGWEWTNPDTAPSTGVPSPKNTLGVTAQGMLDSYKQLHLPEFLAASVATYDQMVVNSLDLGSRMRGPDIPFLVELSEVTGSSEYANFARAEYDTALIDFGNGSATEFAEFIRDVRKGSYPELISWDINLYIQGVLALDGYFGNYGADAVAMAEVIYTSLYVATVDFDIGNPDQSYYSLSVTGALEAFVTTGTHLDKVTELTTSLLSLQQPDGSFFDGSDGEFLQPTAYAIMALVKVDEDRAVISAVNYLIGGQEQNGGWVEVSWGGGTECTEVGSEIAQAIYDFMQP